MAAPIAAAPLLAYYNNNYKIRFDFVKVGPVKSFRLPVIYSCTDALDTYLQCREQRPYPEELSDDFNLHLHLHLHYCSIKMFIPSCCTCHLMLFTELLPFRCIIPPLMLRSLHPIEVVGIITKKKKTSLYVKSQISLYVGWCC